MANTLTFANQTITDAHIFGGVSFLIDLNAGDEFTIGNTASASVSFVTDIQLPLYSKDSTNGTFTWTKDNVSRGRFYITEVTKNADKYTVTAYDAMSLLEKTITVLSITYPVTVLTLATQIATYMGCTISGTINNGSLSVSELDEFMSIRQVLGYIAEASGCSVKVDGSDHLCFMYYEDSEVTKTASEYVSLNVADYSCAAIDNVTIFNSEGEIQATAGSGTNSLYIGQNPFLESATNTNATAIYNAVKDFAYTPLTCDLFDDTDIEVGTIVTFGTTPTLVMHVESAEDGATASSVGSDTRANYTKSALEVVGEARAIAVDAQTMADIATGLLSGMQTAAAAAGTTLNGIYADAETSKDLLSGMQTAATEAGTTLEGIYADAVYANTQAGIANTYANSALDQLGVVENIVGVLDLLQKNGNYQLTEDTEVQGGKWYFTRSGTSPDYVYSVVTNPSGDPNAQGWYELTGIDESIQNYVSSQLVVDDSGLWLKTAGMQTKVLLSATDGVVLYGTNGTVVGKYGETAQIGDSAGFHIEMDGTELGFYQGQRKVAYISNNQLYITQTVVLQSMELGQKNNDGGDGQWAWKVHKNKETPPKNNLYLKWLG